MYLIAADIGNSSTKLAVYNVATDNSELGKVDWLHRFCFRNGVELLGESPLEPFGPADQKALWSVSSVNVDRLKALQAWVNKNRPNDEFHPIVESDVPLESQVESRDQLGRDRLVAAWIATQLNSGGPVIVVDAGTAVTIDFVNADGVFEGGFIFPGATANFQMLEQSTHALPDLSEQAYARDNHGFEIGTSTHSAIINGVIQSQVNAIRGMVVETSERSNTKPMVYVTGGGIIPLASCLPEDWILVEDLVLAGAFEIGKMIAQSI